MLDLNHPHALFVVVAYAVAACVLIVIGATSWLAHRRAARLERELTTPLSGDAL